MKVRILKLNLMRDNVDSCIWTGLHLKISVYTLIFVHLF